MVNTFKTNNVLLVLLLAPNAAQLPPVLLVLMVTSSYKVNACRLNNVDLIISPIHTPALAIHAHRTVLNALMLV